jgi:calreticulin
MQLHHCFLIFRVQVILTQDGKNHLTKKNIKCETDRLSHRYQLVIHPDNTYEVDIDGAKVESGSLFEDWDILPPKTIKDPDAKKPAGEFVVQCACVFASPSGEVG